MLGLPTEIYSYGVQYLYVMGGVVLMGFVMGNIFLPVFHNLNITSTYEVRAAMYADFGRILSNKYLCTLKILLL